MKKAIFTFSLVFIIILPSNSQVFWQDDFESTTPDMGGGTRASSVGNSTDGTCCGSDRFVRSDEYDTATCCGCFTPYSGIINSFAWGGEDLDGTSPCLNQIQTITWTGINIAGRTNLEFLGLFSIAGTSYEGDDELRVEYRIDGIGAFQPGICFSPYDPGFPTLGVDADCDGIVDVPEVSLPTFSLTEYSFSIPSTGTTLELLFTANMNSGGEEFVIDNFRINEGTAMPVELTNFDGFVHNENIKLNWTTASEINNEGFEVEHSIDGRNWSKLGFVLGNANSIQLNRYDFIHKSPKRQINYYRLKQNDFDGQFEYSKVISIDFKGESGQVGEFYPNPSKTGLINLYYSSSNNEQIVVSVFGITGKLMVNQIKQVSIGNNNLSFDFSDLNTGIYIVKIGDERNPTHRKLIIER